MDEIPFHQKPAFRSLLLGLLLLGIYGYELIWQGGLWVNVLGVAFDLVMLAFLFQACVFFYAQFILPIRTLEDRQKIVERLWLRAANAHGPAIFIKNGRKVEREGESEKRGPGVLWVDTASAVVTRSLTAFKQVLPPGVHFLGGKEHIASIVSLHTQTHTIGPNAEDQPFEKLKENATEEENKKYNEVQARRMAVSALTRDGIEVVPRISLTFRIDARPAAGTETGSRFGFNADAVEKAARGEGINPNVNSEERRRVAWNQLPAMIAVDLWREYLSKFTLNELFEANLGPLPEIEQPQEPGSAIQLPDTPLITRSSYFARLLKSVNNSLERRLNESEPRQREVAANRISTSVEGVHSDRKANQPKPQTALQIITQMIRARMTQAVVPVLDDCGRLVEGYVVSDEYKKLKERGLAVSGVSVSGLRFSPSVETQLVQQWVTNWLPNARADRDQVERLNLAYTENGRQQALQDHALALSQAIAKENPRTIPSAVRTLLQRTQSEIKLNDRLLQRADDDVASLDNLMNWIESKDL
jgi:hypothetical protein